MALAFLFVGLVVEVLATIPLIFETATRIQTKNARCVAGVSFALYMGVLLLTYVLQNFFKDRYMPFWILLVLSPPFLAAFWANNMLTAFYSIFPIGTLLLIGVFIDLVTSPLPHMAGDWSMLFAMILIPTGFVGAALGYGMKYVWKRIPEAA